MFRNFSPKVMAYELMSKKYDGARKATGDNIIRSIRFACWVRTATRAKVHAYAPGNPSARTHAHARTEICNS